MSEKKYLQQTLEVEQERLVQLQEHKFLLVSFSKNTKDIEKEIKQCESTIKDLQNKINKL